MNPSEQGQEPLYISVHIPKTAGTTLGMALRSQFGEHLQEAYEEHPGVPRVENPSCIHGHDVLTMFEHVIAGHPNTRWFVFLRDPLSLAVSLYFHTKRTLGPSSFVDRGLVHWLTHVEEYRWPDPPCYSHNQYQFQWVKDCGRSLERFDFVGIAEQFDESILLLSHQFGWDRLHYQARNVASYPRPTLDPGVINRFRQLNDVDYGLYHWSVAVLEKRKQAYGSGFAKDLATFRDRLEDPDVPIIRAPPG